MKRDVIQKEVVALAREGLSEVEIARRVGLSPPAVGYRLRQAGVVARDGREKKSDASRLGGFGDDLDAQEILRINRPFGWASQSDD